MNIRFKSIFIILIAINLSCGNKNQLDPYTDLNSFEKGKESLKKASNATTDTDRKTHYSDAKTNFEKSLLEEEGDKNKIHPLLATALAGLSGVPLYKIISDGEIDFTKDPNESVDTIVPAEPTDTQIDNVDLAISKLKDMGDTFKTDGIKFQILFYSILSTKMTLNLVKNTSSFSEITIENAEKILANLENIIDASLSESDKQKFDEVKSKLDEEGSTSAADKIKSFCEKNPTSQICPKVT